MGANLAARESAMADAGVAQRNQYVRGLSAEQKQEAEESTQAGVKSLCLPPSAGLSSSTNLDDEFSRTRMFC